MITYDELAAGLEDAWLMAGLHDHAIIENIAPETLDRSYRAELFPEHPEPIDETSPPPWVELNFAWTPAHQLRAEGRDIPPGPLELAWTYTIDLRSGPERTDAELLRAFHGAVRAALRRITPDAPQPAEYIAVEIRRGYRPVGDRMAVSYIQLVGTNVTDLEDLWSARAPDFLREALREELRVVAALLHALGETFAPGGLGGYRSVDTA
ncbi:MAG TPA: hypothetical protein PKA05_02095 [Roseiflexaceae bacterium]|nr:hypothetical protein [Roseiflexaceae bacterium]HMP39147.1 hypothetical protein [Roseiflexaceae bacterium]